MDHNEIIDDLLAALAPLRFSAPVTHVYNPLVYAREPHIRYLDHYGRPPRTVLLLGMNPGPWGMAQTGVPFGEIRAVSDWLGIQGRVATPAPMHPKRPVEGFACRRSEVSGRRLWGWAQEAFGSPKRFFERFFVANYCPLVFMEAGGRNRTPDKLPAAERAPLFAACDEALVRTAVLFQAETVVGIGRFAAQRAAAALAGTGVRIGQISHPSPANPKANSGWAALIEGEFLAMGIPLPGLRGR